MSEFELNGETLVSGPQLARVIASRLKIREPSAQSIANWRRAGMPVDGKTGRGPLYDVDKCLRWVRDNKSAGIRGGWRAGAGRKRRPAEPDPAIAARVDAARARAAAVERDLVRSEELLRLTHAELVAIASLQEDESGLSKASLERLKLLVEIRAKNREHEEKLGRLVDAETVAAEVAAGLNELRIKLEQLPHRLLRAVMTATDAAPELEPMVLEAMQGEVAAAVAGLGTRSAG